MIRIYARRIAKTVAMFFLTLVLFHFSVLFYVGREVSATSNTLPPEAEHLYFSYGANMSLKYLANVRNVRPMGRSPGTLEDYQLTFGIKGPNGLEPGFANIQPAPGRQVEGVVYALNDEDFAKIIGSEPDEYGVKLLPVQLDDGTIAQARTLVAKEDGEFMPSTRYLTIMTEGAKEVGLSEDYVGKLEAVNATYTPILSDVMGTVVYTVVFAQSYR